MKRLITIWLMILTLAINAQVELKQKMQGYVNPDELVTLSETISFDQAIQVLSKVSEKISGKNIVSTISSSTPIGVELDKIPYKRALIIIVQYNNFIMQETESTIIVKRKDEIAKQELDKDVYASVEEREVKISAVLFEANLGEMRERGINWEMIFSRSGLSIGGKFITLQEEQELAEGAAATTQQQQMIQKPPTLDLSSESEFEMGKFVGNATSLFRFFESENMGEVIARPTVTVRNKIKGTTQVGSDISIKERDFAGNLIDKFYPTGTIIEVTPHIYNEEGIDYILMQLKVERSTAFPGQLSTEIRKTLATTNVMLLNGEETAIGGLIVYEETTTRRGIPILKDLPWWVLGIRYLTGYDQKEMTKKEIIILVKAEILPTLKERISRQKEENILKKEREKIYEELEKYKSSSKKNEEEEK
ncbi:MAG: hypothetical protein FJ214_09955 [Ignavibacteria bacterium]|nr:hypothetical protein [Ignavibacteria bacterium]